MGRLIDEIEIYKRLRPKIDNGTLDEIMLDIPTVEAIPKADYENRLKSDMVAVLEDLDLLIDEFDSGCGWDGYIKKIDVHKLIQQKINGLRGEAE